MPSSCVSSLLLSFLFFSYATCTPARHRQPYQIRQVDVSIVTGATTRDANGELIHAPQRQCETDVNLGNPFVRREIRDLKQNYPDQWSLYMLALESLMWTSQSDPQSFYGLACK
jgi:tyrosinase